MKRPAHGGNLAWAAALAGCPPGAIADFSASINPLGPPAQAIAAITANLEAIAAYPDPDYPELRAAIGRSHHLPPDWVLPGNGAAELLTWAGREFIGLASVCLGTPAFGDYWRALKALSISVLECPCWQPGGSKVQLSVPAVPLLLPLPSSLPLASSGLLINNPHNPTGTLFDRDSLLPYLEQFALVVVDEAFMDFLPPSQQQSLIPWVEKYPNLVVLRSLTKFYSLPGLRLGYAISHPDRWHRWQQWRDPWPINALAAAAGIAALEDAEFQQQTWHWLPIARSQLFAQLLELPGIQPYPSAANFVFSSTQMPASELQARLLQQSQILIRDCLSFPELGDRYFRVAVRSEAENQRLIAGLKAVLEGDGV